VDDKQRATRDNFEGISSRFTTGFASLAATCVAGILALSGNATPRAWPVTGAVVCFAIGLPIDIMMVLLFFKITEPYHLDSIMDDHRRGYLAWVGTAMPVAGIVAVVCYFSYIAATAMVLLSAALLIWHLRYKLQLPASPST
jgi:hypothetical protein